ncbi:chemotaxis protein CheW [Anaerobacillus alkalilacustris]|nr:chemotaxis protein CheW [Anaerobacillus alkalilacustris]
MLHNQYVVFKLEEGEYGIDIMNVKEISECPTMTMVPNSPTFIEGVINLRGNVIPVINLKKKFHLIDTQIKETSKIIISSLEDNRVGFIVDDASQVLTLMQSDIQSRPELLGVINEKYINGIAKVEEKLIILIDLLETLTADEIKSIKDTKVG